jgi:DNA-binding response OmpR family regulator
MAQPAARPHILVVEDDAGIRRMLELALSGRGYLVECVTDHHGTWGGTPDLVLLDVRLGRYTAGDFLAATRLDERTAVVLMTAGDEIRKVTTELGVRASIAKPFDLDELFEVVERHCRTGSEALPGGN